MHAHKHVQPKQKRNDVVSAFRNVFTKANMIVDFHLQIGGVTIERKKTNSDTNTEEPCDIENVPFGLTVEGSRNTRVAVGGGDISVLTLTDDAISTFTRWADGIGDIVTILATSSILHLERIRSNTTTTRVRVVLEINTVVSVRVGTSRNTTNILVRRACHVSFAVRGGSLVGSGLRAASVGIISTLPVAFGVRFAANALSRLVVIIVLVAVFAIEVARITVVTCSITMVRVTALFSVRVVLDRV